MFKNMKLKQKLVIFFLAVGIIPLTTMAIMSVITASSTMHDMSFNQLHAVQEIKKNQIEKYFNERDPSGHSVTALFKGTVQSNRIDTKAVTEVFAGCEGQEIIKDHEGNSVLSVYKPLILPSGITWAIIAEIDEAEAFAAQHSMTTSALIIGFVGFFIARSISNPVEKIAVASQKMAEGNNDVSKD